MTNTDGQCKMPKSKKRATNITLHSDIVKAAREVFPRTRYRSLSGFVENMLRAELRRRAPKMRKAGIAVPESIFNPWERC